MIHCIKKETKLPPLSSTTDNNFPSSGMQACNYMFIQNNWSLVPGIRNKPKLPAPKVSKDGCQIFDKNRGYDGPDQITAIMWISASCNVKDALTCLEIELEGEKVQICWKLTQKKNTRNQIVIYGLPPGFDTKGIMRELLFGLKECEKELCNANRFTPSQNMEHRDMPLPLLNGYYKQATPTKGLLILREPRELTEQKQGIHAERMQALSPRIRPGGQQMHGTRMDSVH
jgi:hypothetical protein